MQFPVWQAGDGLLVDGVGWAFHALVDGAVEVGVVGEAGGVDLADFVETHADHLACDQIGDGGIMGEQCAIAFNVVGVVDGELAVHDVSWCWRV